MLKIPLRFACGAALGFCFAAASWPQSATWQIDPGHSTASFSLETAGGAARPFNLAIAMVAGRLDFDPDKTSESTLQLNIFPAGESDNLLDRSGRFRAGAFADLTKYSLLTFQSKSSKLTAQGKIEFQGDLTVIHVVRQAEIDWSNAYAGPIEQEPLTQRVNHKATIALDPKALLEANANAKTRADVAALAGIDRATFQQSWDAMRDSVWPVVVFDRDCRMPYYIGPSMRDYNGPACTGTPVTKASYDSSPVPPEFNDIGAGYPPPPSGNEISIAINLHLIHAAPDAARSSGSHSQGSDQKR
jgi:polyisoprenoid-binding protein YceI